jgi:hypothetical protein
MTSSANLFAASRIVACRSTITAPARIIIGNGAAAITSLLISPYDLVLADLSPADPVRDSTPDIGLLSTRLVPGAPGG